MFKYRKPVLFKNQKQQKQVRFFIESANKIFYFSGNKSFSMWKFLLQGLTRTVLSQRDTEKYFPLCFSNRYLAKKGYVKFNFTIEGIPNALCFGSK